MGHASAQTVGEKRPNLPQSQGKVHPRTGHKDPDGEQRYSSTLSLTSALEVGGWSTPRPGRFAPRKDPVPIVEESGWAPGPVWTGAENLAPTRDSIPEPSSPQPVAIPTELLPLRTPREGLETLHFLQARFEDRVLCPCTEVTMTLSYCMIYYLITLYQLLRVFTYYIIQFDSERVHE